MAETVSYGSYTFPTPTPMVGEGNAMAYVSGKLDHSVQSVSIVGTITGENISGLDVQKMRMISGMLSEFQTLEISNDSETKTYLYSKPENISFGSSDLTTVLPYSVNFTSYSSGTFLADFFGIQDPTDTWTFSEQDSLITQATHAVSAKGVKSGSQTALANARDFVTGRMTGFANISLFQTGVNEVHPFLTSRNEDINRTEDRYSLTEVYLYSKTNYLPNESGVLTVDTSLNYDTQSPLSVSVKGSLLGSMDANITGGLLTTGNFPPESGQQVAVNAVVSSLSDFESGAYSFVNRAPTTINYTIDTGENRLDFSFEFRDADNIDQTGNVLHTQSYSVSASKDQASTQISIEGEFKYNAPFDIITNTGDPLQSDRFMEVQKEYSGVSTTSGFFNMAVEALKYFTGDATGYFISGDYVNPTPISSGISKKPDQGSISYNMEYSNKYDLSSGELTGLSINITDRKPIEISGIVPSLVGFAKQQVMQRSIGTYGVAASCEGNSGQIPKLIEVVSGYITGNCDAGKSSSVDDTSISFSLSRYY